MLKHIDGYRATLRAKLSASDTTLLLFRSEAMALNQIGVGNYTYLVLRDRKNYEVVRYVHSANWDSSDPSLVHVPVQRNQNGGGAKNFPYGICVVAEMTSMYVNDYINGMGNDLTTSNTTPATTASCELPTTLFGGRTSALGQPAVWLESGSLLIPGYRRQ